MALCALCFSVTWDGLKCSIPTMRVPGRKLRSSCNAHQRAHDNARSRGTALRIGHRHAFSSSAYCLNTLHKGLLVVLLLLLLLMGLLRSRHTPPCQGAGKASVQRRSVHPLRNLLSATL
jgi:hypothetical protein